MENYCKPPKPTQSELRLRKILERKQVPFHYDKVISFTMIKLSDIQAATVLHRIY